MFQPLSETFFRPLAHRIRSCYTQQLLAAAVTASGVRAPGRTGAGPADPLLSFLSCRFIYSNKCVETQRDIGNRSFIIYMLLQEQIITKQKLICSNQTWTEAFSANIGSLLQQILLRQHLISPPLNS